MAAGTAAHAAIGHARVGSLGRIEGLFDISLLSQIKVLVAGCGSGGASVALHLAMSGVRNFTLIDKDLLGTENIIRHVCGRRYIGMKKVDAVADVIRDRIPTANINPINTLNINNKNDD